jgi:hypothetical protein
MATLDAYQKMGDPGRNLCKARPAGDDFFLRIRGTFAPLLAASRFVAFVASRQ